MVEDRNIDKYINLNHHTSTYFRAVLEGAKEKDLQISDKTIIRMVKNIYPLEICSLITREHLLILAWLDWSPLGEISSSRINEFLKTKLEELEECNARI